MSKKKRLFMEQIIFRPNSTLETRLYCQPESEKLDKRMRDITTSIISTISLKEYIAYSNRYNSDGDEINIVIADIKTGIVKKVYRLYIDDSDYIEVYEEALLKNSTQLKNIIRVFKTMEEAQAYVSECIQNSDYTVDEDKSSLNKIYASYKSIVREFTIVE